VDIKAYIESGAIEAYVLGLASAAEAAELETLRKQYPELHNAIIAFEMQLEHTVMAGSETPPSFIKQQLNERLAADFRSNGNGKVLPIENRVRVKPLWKYMAAASIILLVASAALNFYLYDRYRFADTAYNELFTQTQTLQANNDVMNTRLNEMNESMKIMADPAMIPISLTAEATPKKGENFRATVYWDSKTKDVYLLSNNLPRAPAGKQYQLWAIVDGRPVDAGMMDDCTGICHMKNIPKAQLFAITLEETGGKSRPEGEMYVLGKI
jgi:anti-sigma-K factor RskA